MFFIVVDAHSKWPEVIEMSATTTSHTITELRKLFAVHGLPKQLVSDNGPQFTSVDFATFCKMNGIKHIRCAPYHPSSNGQAERFVQTFKRAMKASSSSQTPLSQRLSSFLLQYRCTPHSTTNRPPCELFVGHRLRTRLDLLRPSDAEHVQDKQAQQKRDHDKHARERELEPGQTVMARNFRPGPDWVPAVITRQLAPLTYEVRVNGGQLWTRHVDHLRLFQQEGTTEATRSNDDDLTFPVTQAESETEQANPARATERDQEPPDEAPTHRHYPVRDRRPPDRFM